MSDHFQHVMVLISIIIGLGITNLLSGFTGAIDRLPKTDNSCQKTYQIKSPTQNTRPLDVGQF